MIKQLTIGAITALALTAGSAFAAGKSGHVEDFDFSFEGPFGTFDQNQLQRGLQIKEKEIENEKKEKKVNKKIKIIEQKLEKEKVK